MLQRLGVMCCDGLVPEVLVAKIDCPLRAKIDAATIGRNMLKAWRLRNFSLELIAHWALKLMLQRLGAMC